MLFTDMGPRFQVLAHGNPCQATYHILLLNMFNLKSVHQTSSVADLPAGSGTSTGCWKNRYKDFFCPNFKLKWLKIRGILVQNNRDNIPIRPLSLLPNPSFPLFSNLSPAIVFLSSGGRRIRWWESWWRRLRRLLSTRHEALFLIFPSLHLSFPLFLSRAHLGPLCPMSAALPAAWLRPAKVSGGLSFFSSSSLRSSPHLICATAGVLEILNLNDCSFN